MSTSDSRRAALERAGALETTGTTEFTILEGEAYTPKVPGHVRDIAYFTGLGVSAATLLGVGIVGIWFPQLADQVAQTGVVVGSTVGLVTNGLGVVYRPGRNG